MDITARGLQQGRQRQHISEGRRGYGPRAVLSSSRIGGSGGHGIVIDVGGWK